jgi:hypothetical protein
MLILRSFLVVFAVAMASPLQAQVLIHDTFGNGVLGTNTGGTGQGFNAGGSQTVPTESGGVVNFTAGGYSVQQIASNAADAFNPFQSTPTALSVSFGTFGYDSGFDRQWVGFVATGSSSLFYFPGSSYAAAQGLYLSFAYNNANEDGTFGNATSHRGNLVAVSNAGVMTTLASWDWSTAPTAGFAASLTTTGSTYALAFTGATVSSFATGTSTGALTGLGTISGNFDAFVFGQVITGANGFTLDSLSVSVIPEPSTYAAIAGVVVLGGVWLRRRRRAA